MNKKFVVCGYATPAIGAIRILIDEMNLPTENIYCVTYNTEGNALLIEFLQKRGIGFIVGSIKTKIVYERIKDFSPDYIASIHFRDIIPIEIINLANEGTFNIHPSLLPKYKGCFSSCWALINDEMETGVTFHSINEKIDCGDILWQSKILINENDTGYTLFHRLISEALINFKPFVENLIHNKIKPIKMPSGGQYYGRKVPFNGFINPSWDNRKIEQFIKAMFFPPFRGAVIQHEGQEIEINTYEEYLSIT